MGKEATPGGLGEGPTARHRYLQAGIYVVRCGARPPRSKEMLGFKKKKKKAPFSAYLFFRVLFQQVLRVENSLWGITDRVRERHTKKNKKEKGRNGSVRNEADKEKEIDRSITDPLINR